MSNNLENLNKMVLEQSIDSENAVELLYRAYKDGVVKKEEMLSEALTIEFVLGEMETTDILLDILYHE